MKSNTGKIDNGAALGHRWECCLGGQVISAQVEGKKIIPLSCAHPIDGHARITCRIVDQDMDGAHCLLDPPDPELDLTFLFEVYQMKTHSVAQSL